MRTPARPLRIPAVAVAGVLVLGLAACGDDSSSDPTASPPTTVAAVTLPAVVATTAAPAASTTVAAVTVPATVATSATATTIPGLIEVTVGVDSGADRIETVPVGESITLKLTDPNADAEFHVHVVDLGDGEVVPKGTTKTFTFTPKAVGDIEVESHYTEDVLVIIRVVA